LMHSRSNDGLKIKLPKKDQKKNSYFDACRSKSLSSWHLRTVYIPHTRYSRLPRISCMLHRRVLRQYIFKLQRINPIFGKVTKDVLPSFTYGTVVAF
jgi:hypothetical protein